MIYVIKRSKVADQITEIFNNTIKRNKWDMSRINVDIKDDNDAVDYITKKIKKRPVMKRQKSTLERSINYIMH